MTTPSQPTESKARPRWRAVLDKLRLARRKAFPSRQRGIALFLVMVAISIILAITNQFATNATIDLMAAANYRDQMRAHFLARTALDVSELVIKIQRGVEGRAKGVDITTYADQLMMAFCGSKVEISEALGVPVDRVKGLGSEIGNCGLTPAITTDDAKINLNCAENQSIKESLSKRLMSLLYFSAFDPVFNESDAEDWRRDRETQVSALMDYVDKDSTRGTARGTGEDYGYESLRDSYKAKQNYMDTVGEIKLVRGVDDRFWTLFGNAFTVYGGCKLNLASVDDAGLLASTLMLAAENENDPMLRDQRRLWLLASIVIKAREFGVTFDKTDELISFVKDPMESIGKLMSRQGSSAATNPFGLAPGEKIGLALSKTKLESIATTEKKRTYRVTAWGEVGRAQVDQKGNPIFPPVRRTITAVWDFKATPQNRRKSSGGSSDSGAWVFMKEQ